MLFLRLAAVIGGVVLLVAGIWASVWVHVEGEDPNVVVSTVPLLVAVLGLALVVRVLRSRRP